MITVLCVAQELKDLKYREVFGRLTPPSLRDVERLVPARASPVLPSLTPSSPANGRHPRGSTCTPKSKRASAKMARGLGMASRSFDVDSAIDQTSRSPHANEAGETGSPRGAPGCPPRAPSTTEQGKLRGSPGGARATASSSIPQPDQDQTLRAVMGRVDAMLALFPSTSSNRSQLLAALRLSGQTAQAQVGQQLHLSPRAALPTPPPTPPPMRANKRRYRSPPASRLASVDANKRVRQLSLISPGRLVGAQALTGPAPPPAVSSFIPVAHESQFQDVLTAGGQPTCLGRGAFGEVFLKRERSPGGALVAFKTLTSAVDAYAGYQGMVEELRAMMAVQHRPEFPKLLGIVSQTTFAVEFVGDALTMQSRTLRSVVTQPPAGLYDIWLVKICGDVARGLQALHYAGWSHNDLHCSNVLVWRQPTAHGDIWGAKIIDLGKATRLNNPPPPQQYDPATKAYCYRHCIHISPEVIEGTIQQGVLTDLYSLGYLFNVVSYSNPRLTVIQTLHQHCSRAPKDRPLMQSIIQDIDGFQTALFQDAMQRQMAATAPHHNAPAQPKPYQLF